MPVGDLVGKPEAEAKAKVEEWAKTIDPSLGEGSGEGQIYLQVLGDPAILIGTHTDNVAGKKMGFDSLDAFAIGAGLNREKWRKLAVGPKTTWYMARDGKRFAIRAEERDFENRKLWWINFFDFRLSRLLQPEAQSDWKPSAKAIAELFAMKPLEAIETIGPIRDFYPASNGGVKSDSGLEVEVQSGMDGGSMELLLSDFGGSFKVEEPFAKGATLRFRVGKQKAPTVRAAFGRLGVPGNPKLGKKDEMEYQVVSGVSVKGCFIRYIDGGPEHVVEFIKD